MILKDLKKIIVLFIICLVCFATNVKAASNNILSISSQTVSLNTDFYLILNLANIPFTKFKVEIANTSSLKPNELTSEVSNLSTNTGTTTFIVDKNSIGLDKLGIVYTSGKETSAINFQVTISSLDKNESTLQAEITKLQEELVVLETDLNSLKNSLEGITEDSPEYETINNKIITVESSINLKNEEIENLSNEISNFTEEKVSESISVEVANTNQVENNEELGNKDKSAWGEMDSMLSKDKMMKEMEDEKMSSSMKEMMSKMNSLESDLKNANNTISSLTSSNTYKGSQNNYLASLSITGVDFKNEFKKTTSDYFATVSKDTTSVTVNAVAEDSASVVTIYGNTNLQEGKNKVIISVTSEDGSVRNYKIYITK